MNRALLKSGRDDWETPQALYDELDAEFGFTVDACATQHNAKCQRFFSPEQDGLLQDWSGETVWINPPYSTKLQDAFVRKAYECGYNGCCVASGQNRHKTVSQVYTRKSGDSLFTRQDHFCRRGEYRSVSEHGCGLAFERRNVNEQTKVPLVGLCEECNPGVSGVKGTAVRNT